MNRKSSWPEILSREIDKAADFKFSWGQHDCALFACNIVKAMTGEDPAKAFRGQYNTEHGAREALREHGGGTLYRTAIKMFGAPTHAARAQRGDMVYLDKKQGGPALGICVGSHAAFAGDGITFRPMTECKHSWRVGHG